MTQPRHPLHPTAHSKHQFNCHVLSDHAVRVLRAAVCSARSALHILHTRPINLYINAHKTYILIQVTLVYIVSNLRDYLTENLVSVSSIKYTYFKERILFTLPGRNAGKTY